MKLKWNEQFPNNITDVLGQQNINFLIPKCPKQNNMYDCGIYLLQYAESFLEVNYFLKDKRYAFFIKINKSIFQHQHREFALLDESWVQIIPNKRSKIIEDILPEIIEAHVIENIFCEIIESHNAESYHELICSDIPIEKNQYIKKENKNIKNLNRNANIITKVKRINFKQNTCNKNSYKCPECPYRGRDNDNIRVHLKQHNNKSESKIKCNSCSFYCTINNMAKHKNVHSSRF